MLIADWASRKLPARQVNQDAWVCEVLWGGTQGLFAVVDGVSRCDNPKLAAETVATVVREARDEPLSTKGRQRLFDRVDDTLFSYISSGHARKLQACVDLAWINLVKEGRLHAHQPAPRRLPHGGGS